jgi:dethiobiotin synthetase
MQNYPHTLFVTGTDTGIGKTRAALSLMAALQCRGLRVAAMKPVASGCEVTAAGLRNDDAEALLRQTNVSLSYEEINPYTFAPPIAPHLAAIEVNQTVNINYIINIHAALRQRADVIIVEGAGGWRVPLNQYVGFCDLAAALDAQVILVVGLRLGCINHALLSAEAIWHDGLALFGWLGNHIDPEFEYQGSVDTIRSWLGLPPLGILDYAETFDTEQAVTQLAQF